MGISSVDEIMTDNTKFPEKTEYSKWEAYPPEEVDDWFKRMIADIPLAHIPRYPTPESVADSLMDYAIQSKDWAVRWLKQFEEEE